MNRKYISNCVLCLLITVSITSVYSISASANPILVSMLDEGAAFHNGEFIQMPSANVEINITRSLKTVLVDLIGIYSFETNQTQNTTLAYVYPALVSGTLQEANLAILVDSIQTPYTIKTLYDLQEEFDLSDEIRKYTSIYADLAFLEVSFVADQSMTMEVHSRTNFTLGDETYWYYNYIFGSARTFDGDTLERIHIHLTQETSFFETRFEPESHLDLTGSGIVTDATWEFNVSDLEENRVTFSGLVNLPPPDLATILFLSITTISAIIIIVYVVKHRRR